MSGGNRQSGFLAKENIVRRGVKDSRRRGNIRSFKRYWNAGDDQVPWERYRKLSSKFPKWPPGGCRAETVLAGVGKRSDSKSMSKLLQNISVN